VLELTAPKVGHNPKHALALLPFVFFQRQLLISSFAFQRRLARLLGAVGRVGLILLPLGLRGLGCPLDRRRTPGPKG
jgi:hypothetical protein